MKHCIAVVEVLRRDIVVESDSYENALKIVQDAYDNQQIVLTADDLAWNGLGESVRIEEAVEYDFDEVQNMELTRF